MSQILQLIWGVESQGENISTDICIRLVGGGLAGITAASVTYPLDLVRTRLAAQVNIIIQSLIIFSPELFGIFLWLKSQWIWFILFTLNMLTEASQWGMGCKWEVPGSRPPTYTKKKKTKTHWICLILLQTNVMYYRGIWHALCTISKEEGASGLYKGLGATLLVHYMVFNPFLPDYLFHSVVWLLNLLMMQGVGPNLAISFSAYDTARTLWQSHR